MENTESRQHSPLRVSWLFGAVIFLSAFLLFQLQPLISKRILPWFGGSPAVWTTCMLFFQTLLLAGYLYADRLSRLTSSRLAFALHAVVIVAAALTFSFSRAEVFRPTDSRNPTLTILCLLFATIGSVYFVLATTGPLLQAWFARSQPHDSPYRFYALSNLGSLGALLSYPVFVEPYISLGLQCRAWAGGLFLYLTLLLILMQRLNRHAGIHACDTLESIAGDHDDISESSVTFGARWNWVLWPCVASAMLLAVTNQLCQNVAVIPLLWIAPLSLYLASFIICFDSERWYVPRYYAMACVVSLIWLAKLLLAYHFRESTWYFEPEAVQRLASSQPVQIASYLITLFLASMICHGEVARRKPTARHLTRYYLALAAGGALGGACVSVVCPMVFTSYFELNLLLGLMLPLALLALYRDIRTRWLSRRWVRSLFFTMAVVASATLLFSLVQVTHRPSSITVRNFYGVLSVTSSVTPPSDFEVRRMYSGVPMHGGITMHGYQDLSPDERRHPTTYYAPATGIGWTLTRFPQQTRRRIGVIGLGVGTLAAYGERGDTFRFYELNPAVEQLAGQYFSYLSDCVAEVQIVLGDGRLSLEREPGQNFDVLVVDAFTGDTIPTHLLTREAFAVYLRHLAPDGVLAIHVSNRYLNLAPIITRLASERGIPFRVTHNTDGPRMTFASDWVLLSQNAAIFAELDQTDLIQVTMPTSDNVWTDDYNSLFQLLWRGKAKKAVGESEREFEFGPTFDVE